MLGHKQLQDLKMKEEDRNKHVKKRDWKERNNFNSKKIIKER